MTELSTLTWPGGDYSRDALTRPIARHSLDRSRGPICMYGSAIPTPSSDGPAISVPGPTTSILRAWSAPSSQARERASRGALPWHRKWGHDHDGGVVIVAPVGTSDQGHRAGQAMTTPSPGVALPGAAWRVTWSASGNT